MKKFYSNNLVMFASITKAVTGVVGASLILAEDHPYLALTCLAIGAGVNELLMFIEKSRRES